MSQRLIPSILLLLLTATIASGAPVTFEQLFGATNINGAVGNGRVTAAFSARGEMTVFRWPTPSFYEHLGYMTANVPDVRDLPRLGAMPEMGAFFGVVYQSGGQTYVSWPRDPEWTVAQRYKDFRSNVLVTVAQNATLGLTVTTHVFASPNDDVLVWRMDVGQDTSSDVEVTGGLFYENLSPCTHQMPLVPVDGWALDFLNDYAAIYDKADRAVTHFRSPWKTFSHLTPLLSIDEPVEEQSRHFLDEDVTDWEDGVFFGVTLLDKEFRYQVGTDDADNCGMLQNLLGNLQMGDVNFPDWLGNIPLCLLDPLPVYPLLYGWRHRPESAYADALDGELSGSTAAGIQTNASLLFPLDLAASGSDGATVLIAASDTLAGLRGTLERSRDENYEYKHNDVERYWRAWTTGAVVPDTDDPVVRDFATRALISIKTAMDPETGNIVASVSSVPPYNFDWPRDSAFINYALDLAGYREEVTRHNESYVGWQRKEALPFSLAPAGTYEMNYDPRGLPGGPIYFEIDNAGLITWSLWNHYEWLKDDGDPYAPTYLDNVYDAIALAADSLADCRDDATGLQCYAMEDDTTHYSQSLQGASAVYAALSAGIAAGTEIGEETARIDAWTARAEELKAASFEYFWSDAEGRFTGNFSGENWAVFPAGLLSLDDPRIETQMDWFESNALGVLEGHSEHMAYNAKGFLTLTWYDRQVGNEERLETMRGVIHDFLAWIPTQDTRHMGEVAICTDGDGDGFRENVVNEVGQPHVWEQTINYLAAVFAYGGVPLPAEYTDDDIDDDSSDDASDDSGDDSQDDTGDTADDSSAGDDSAANPAGVSGDDDENNNACAC